MPDTNDDIKKLLTDVQRYLKEEQELFGDYIYTESTMPPKKQAGKPEAQQPSKPPLEQDLFGSTAPPAKPGKIAEQHTPYPNEPWVKSSTLDELNSMICNCTKCSLGHTRTKFVFGVGNPNADIVIVGEAPGADEDAQGEPFVGRAGQLLNKILEAINFKREEVYICNILKCRPPGNRDPQPEEVEACIPHLWKQIEIIKPKLILCLGRISAQMLLKTNASLGDMRGKVHDYRGIKMMVTYHPAALLRNPNWKKPTWEDVQKFRKMYDEMKQQP
ncbi:MAG: uracil-DNA glycosylase [Ignavibacteriae bacterium]|nr:uracil-DNA glycosylase [Ignavibacteriota bacterium]